MLRVESRTMSKFTKFHNLQTAAEGEGEGEDNRLVLTLKVGEKKVHLFAIFEQYLPRNKQAQYLHMTEM